MLKDEEVLCHCFKRTLRAGEGIAEKVDYFQKNQPILLKANTTTTKRDI
jgi:hypothetical protein